MDMVDFQEKMDPTHRMYLCRMLSEKELPVRLLKRYAQVKTLIDRIDCHLTPGDLAMIIISAGFTAQGETTEEKDAIPAEEPAMTGEQAEAEIASGAAVPVEPAKLDESDDKVIEEAVKQGKVDGGKILTQSIPAAAIEKAAEQPVNGTTGQSQEKPTEVAKLWFSGMPVKVLKNEELKPGKILAVHPSGEGNVQTKLTIALEGGETVVVNEDEVDAD